MERGFPNQMPASGASMTKYEREQLAFHRTPEGERIWRMSDLAYEEYMRLVEKEKNNK